MENINKKSQEELSSTVISKLDHLLDNSLISGPEFGGLRDSIASVKNIINNEFVPDKDNKEIVDRAVNKLIALIDNPELSEQKFLLIRSAIGSILNIVNNDLN